MKVSERQSYGHCGLDVRFNVMDQVALNQTKEALTEWMNEWKESYEKCGIAVYPPTEVLNNLIIMLGKLALKPELEATVFTPDAKDVTAEEKEA